MVYITDIHLEAMLYIGEGRKFEGNCCSATGLLLEFISKNVLSFITSKSSLVLFVLWFYRTLILIQ